MLLAMENKRMRSTNEDLVGLNMSLEARVASLLQKLSKFENLEEENQRMSQELKQYEGKVGTFITERTTIISEFESFKKESMTTISSLEDKIRLLAAENESLQLALGRPD